MKKRTLNPFQQDCLSNTRNEEFGPDLIAVILRDGEKAAASLVNGTATQCSVQSFKNKSRWTLYNEYDLGVCKTGHAVSRPFSSSLEMFSLAGLLLLLGGLMWWIHYCL